MARSLRTRIENSDRLARVLGTILGSYLMLCLRTGQWINEGDDDLDALLEHGPVTAVSWHGRSVMGPVVWQSRGPSALPRDPSPAGRLSEAIQRKVGTRSILIDTDGGNFSIVRQIIKMVRSGASLGLTADGPEGPDRVVKTAPLEWMRAAGRPVVVFAWSSKKARQFNTWDKMLFPLPFAGGVWVYHRWDASIPKNADAAKMEELRASLAQALDDVGARADTIAGRVS
jgi:lysophospholipid acyltransferase (LPLAT)-like uncharacterized protein